jgi:hypothetical protein
MNNLKCLVIISEFSEQNISNKIKILKSNLEIFDRTSKNIEFYFNIFTYHDEIYNLDKLINSTKINININKIKSEKITYSELIYNIITPEYMNTYDYFCILLDNVELSENMNIHELFLNYEYYNFNILSLSSSITENVDLLFQIMDNKTYNKYYSLLDKQFKLLGHINHFFYPNDFKIGIINITDEYNIKSIYNGLLFFNTIYKTIETYPFIYDTKYNIVGLIPCAGTASRIFNIPKFLLPCISSYDTEYTTLINNALHIFKKNNINDIFLGTSRENEQYVKKYEYKYFIKNTKTMSQTVKNLTFNIDSEKYIMIMPDTYFLINDEIMQLVKKLNNHDIVVILWKIKPQQYGKLGQIDISGDFVVDICDKNPECKYKYSWGVIGWNKKADSLNDPNTYHIGMIISEGLKRNYSIGYVISQSEYFDCGTPAEYFEMIKKTVK